jgi:hypothetical protein
MTFVGTERGGLSAHGKKRKDLRFVKLLLNAVILYKLHSFFSCSAWIFFFFLVVPEFELRASSLLADTLPLEPHLQPYIYT